MFYAGDDNLSEPIQVDFSIAGGVWPSHASKLGSLKLPIRSFVPKTGSRVSEFQVPDSIPYRVIGRMFDRSGQRVTLTLKPE